jgi:hypothetical protein
MVALTPVSLNSVAVVGVSCGDIAVGAGATLSEIACGKPDLVVHALALTGGSTDREIEEKNAFVDLTRVRGCSAAPATPKPPRWRTQCVGFPIRRRNMKVRMLLSDRDGRLICRPTFSDDRNDAVRHGKFFPKGEFE